MKQKNEEERLGFVQINDKKNILQILYKFFSL